MLFSYFVWGDTRTCVGAERKKQSSYDGPISDEWSEYIHLLYKK